MINKHKTIVIGGGLSGLMMGYLLKRDYIILESAKALTYNADAPFYLHAPIDWLPTTWKAIDVHTNCWDGVSFHRVPTIDLMNAYARKITGKIHDTALKFLDGSVKTGYLPACGSPGQVIKDLHDEVASHVVLDSKVEHINSAARAVRLTDGRIFEYERLISTMPMPALLGMVGVPTKFQFKADPIYTALYKVPEGLSVDAYQILYITSHHRPYRLALMNNMVFAESMVPMDDQENVDLIDQLWNFEPALHEKKVVRPGKFHPIELMQRKLLLAHLTKEHQIYCLGRYAVWSYKRIDHIAEDAQQIVKLIKTQEVA